MIDKGSQHLSPNPNFVTNQKVSVSQSHVKLSPVVGIVVAVVVMPAGVGQSSMLQAFIWRSCWLKQDDLTPKTISLSLS